MNRRALFQAMAGLATAGAVGVSVKAAPPPQKYGRLTVGGHRGHLHATGETLHVYVDGREALHCYEADDVEGYALVLCTDPDGHRDYTKAGHLHVGGEGACRLRLTGRVVIAPGAPWKGQAS